MSRIDQNPDSCDQGRPWWEHSSQLLTDKTVLTLRGLTEHGFACPASGWSQPAQNQLNTRLICRSELLASNGNRPGNMALGAFLTNTSDKIVGNIKSPKHSPVLLKLKILGCPPEAHHRQGIYINININESIDKIKLRDRVYIQTT